MIRNSAPPATSQTLLPANATSDEVVMAFDAFMRSFEAFKEANDQRLAEIEHQVGADVVTVEKMNRINRALDEHKSRLDHLMLRGRRPTRADGRWQSATATEHKTAWNAYMRAGETHGLRAAEVKALSIQSDPDGGYLVPDETESEIARLLATISPIRAIASVRQVSGALYKKPFATSGAAVGWVGETDTRPETMTPTLSELQFPTMELYAMPAATATLLDDSAVNIDQWLAEEVRTAFAEQESLAFIQGDGVNKPRGFMDYPTIDNSQWSWGNLGTIASGAAGGFDADAPADALIDLIYALRAGYRANGRFVMNRRTQAEIRKIKDADGNYIWQPSLQPNTAPTLMNFAVEEAEDMPNIDDDKPAIAFGDFTRGYLIVDRLGIRVLRDPFTSKPYVLFYTTKRVGGGVQDFDAIKLLSFSA